VEAFLEMIVFAVRLASTGLADGLVGFARFRRGNGRHPHGRRPVTRSRVRSFRFRLMVWQRVTGLRRAAASGAIGRDLSRVRQDG
jgi:hypothetical protein